MLGGNTNQGFDSGCAAKLADNGRHFDRFGAGAENRENADHINLIYSGDSDGREGGLPTPRRRTVNPACCQG